VIDRIGHCCEPVDAAQFASTHLATPMS